MDLTVNELKRVVLNLHRISANLTNHEISLMNKREWTEALQLRDDIAYLENLVNRFYTLIKSKK
jgi:hypothetical protein